MSKWIYQLSFRMYPLYKGMDPDNAFMYLFLHHIIQALLYLLLILIAARLQHKKLRDFGFNLNQYKFSLLYTLIIIVLSVILQFGIGYLMFLSNTIYYFGFPLNSRNFMGYFLFEILVSGSSEELFFRSFIITIMLSLLKKYFKRQKNLYFTVVILNAIIFMAAHIDFDLIPLRINYIVPLQQLTAMILAVVYSIAFLKTKSLLAPILIHNLFNGVVTLSTLLFINLDP